MRHGQVSKTTHCFVGCLQTNSQVGGGSAQQRDEDTGVDE